jgi:hypothetical protein
MAIRVVQLGTERDPGEGPRLGTVRRPKLLAVLSKADVLPVDDAAPAPGRA